MPEAQDPTQAAQEPSMEEILASIRKIISDEEPAAETPAADDVLELTQEIKDDGTITNVTEPPAEEITLTAEVAPTPAPATAFEPPAPVAAAEPLVSEVAASATASVLSSLANTVEIERLSTAPQMGSYLGNGGRTLEDMALELLRPLLKDWLDKNLPATVDRLVQKEIERISRKV